MLTLSVAHLQLVITGVSSIESTFAYFVAKGPASREDPDQAALTVTRAVLNAMEGFLWKCASCPLLARARCAFSS